MGTRVVVTDIGICIKNKQNEFKHRTLQINWTTKIILVGKKGQIQIAYPFSDIIACIPSESKFTVMINICNIGKSDNSIES